MQEENQQKDKRNINLKFRTSQLQYLLTTSVAHSLSFYYKLNFKEQKIKFEKKIKNYVSISYLMYNR